MSLEFRERLDAIRRRVAEEFRRNQKLHRGRIHCKRGCDDCCHHIFQITEIEAAEISRFVRQLPAARRAVLEQRAREYRPARDAIMRRHGYLDARGNLPPAETRLACPALLEGSCGLYEQRPLICRKYGMPLVDVRQPQRVFACELNFQPGDQFNDGRLVQIQTDLAENWEQIQKEYDRAGGRRRPLPISVADAILEDFEGYPPHE